LIAEILKTYEKEIEAVTIIPSRGGRFELTVNGHLLFSKLELGRHARPNEIMTLLKEFRDTQTEGKRSENIISID